MRNIIDVLRDQYNMIINQEKSWGFFSALIGYINYILETPILKKISDEAINKKLKEYDKLATLEEKSLRELKQVKNKLLKIIKDNNISPDSLTDHRWSSIPNPSGCSNILESLRAFESGGISISGFKSDNLERYLFDIAISILKLNYKKQLNDFLVSNQKYGEYYREPDNRIITTGNENGNFIFSKTLKLRRQQSKFIEKTEKFEIWGAFNTLFKFQKAFLEKSQNKGFGYISQKYSEGVRNSQEARDAIDIVFFAQDLEILAESKSGEIIDPYSIYYLKKDNFKNYLSMVNTYLIKELAKTENKKEHSKKRFSFKNQQLKYEDTNIVISKSKNTNPYFLLKILLKNIKKEWAYDELWDSLYGTTYEPEEWKKIYNTAYDLNEKVARQTKINDLIDITKTIIKINPKYLD